MQLKKMMMVLAAGSLAIAAQGLTLSVKDVKIAQRYPWNGLVDIDYTVECDDKDADVYVYPVGYDVDMNLSIPPRTLTGDGANGKAVKAGTHRMTWDMAKDMGENYNRAKFSMKVHAYAGAAPYMVIDLSAGSDAEKYEVSYMSEMPENGWTDEYKGTKLVLKVIPPGTFMMGSPNTEQFREYNSKWMRETLHKVKLTQPFYCSVFPITEQQWSLVMGGTSSSTGYKSALSYNDLRGSTLGSKYPSHQQVDAESFLGKLRSRTGITFDLPTEAQWEYACRAGSGEAVSTNPNAFGLYAMNNWPSEWCLDWENYNYTDNGTTIVDGMYIDPTGPTSGSKRAFRSYVYHSYGSSGYFKPYEYRDVRSAMRWSLEPSSRGYYYNDCGCRLVALPAAK